MIFKLLRVIGFKISGAVKVEGCGQPTAVVDSYTVQCTTIYGTLQFKIQISALRLYSSLLYIVLNACLMHLLILTVHCAFS